MSSTFTVLGSTLILALSQPQAVQVSGPQVWISDPKVVQAQPMQGNSALLIGKSLGEIFLHGLAKTDPQRAVVTTPANVGALKRCPAARAFLTAHHDGSLRANAWSEPLRLAITDCGFDLLSLDDCSGLGDYLKAQHSTLKKIGVAISQAQVRAGRVLWMIPDSSVKQMRRELSAIASFSDFQIDASRSAQSIVYKLDLFEFSRSSQESMDLWASSNPEIIGSRLQSDSKLALIFERARQNGRLVASPQIRTTAGQTATFGSGGEIPIQDAQLVGSKTTWKSYGLRLLVTPESGASPLWPEINTQIEIEYLQPDYGNTSQQVPAMIKRQLQSAFSLPTGQTTVLTSMIYQRAGRGDRQGLGLGAIPLLGAIFGGSHENETQNELWFLITPTWSEKLEPQEPAAIWKRYGKIR